MLLLRTANQITVLSIPDDHEREALRYGPWHSKDTWENRDFDPLKVVELVR